MVFVALIGLFLFFKGFLYCHDLVVGLALLISLVIIGANTYHPCLQTNI